MHVTSVQPTMFRAVYGVIMLLVGLVIFIEPSGGSMRVVSQTWNELWGVHISPEFVAATFFIGGMLMIGMPTLSPAYAFFFAMPFLIYGVTLTWARLFIANVPAAPAILFLGLFLIKLAHTWDTVTNGTTNHRR